MDHLQIFAAIIALWVIILAALAWILLIKPRTRPTSIRSAMLIMGLLTVPASYVAIKDVGMTLAVLVMPVIGAAIGEVAIPRWNKTHANE